MGKLRYKFKTWRFNRALERVNKTQLTEIERVFIRDWNNSSYVKHGTFPKFDAMENELLMQSQLKKALEGELDIDDGIYQIIPE